MSSLKLRYADQIVGAFVLFALVVVVGVGFFVVKGQNLFVERTPFWTLFDDGAGIAPDTPVKIKGIEVGKVRSLTLTQNNKVRVEFDVLAEFADRIRADVDGQECDKRIEEDDEEKAKAIQAERDKWCGSRVATSTPAGLGGFLPGGSGIKILVGSQSPYNKRIEPGGFVRSERPEGFSEIMDRLRKEGVVKNAQEIVKQIAILLKNVNNAKGPVWETLNNVKVVTSRLRRGQGVVGQLLAPQTKLKRDVDRALESLNATLISLESAAKNTDTVSGKLDADRARLMAVVENLKAFSDDLKVVSADLKVFADASKAVPTDISAGVTDIRAATKNLDARIDDLGQAIEGLKNTWPIGSNMPSDEAWRAARAAERAQDEAEMAQTRRAAAAARASSSSSSESAPDAGAR